MLLKILSLLGYDAMLTGKSLWTLEELAAYLPVHTASFPRRLKSTHVIFKMELRSTVFREPNLFSVRIFFFFFCAVLGIPLCVSECVPNDFLSLLAPCNGHRQ
jgi:hypothetical protein